MKLLSASDIQELRDKAGRQASNEAWGATAVLQNNLGYARQDRADAFSEANATTEGLRSLIQEQIGDVKSGRLRGHDRQMALKGLRSSQLQAESTAPWMKAQARDAYQETSRGLVNQQIQNQAALENATLTRFRQLRENKKDRLRIRGNEQQDEVDLLDQDIQERREAHPRGLEAGGADGYRPTSQQVEAQALLQQQAQLLWRQGLPGTETEKIEMLRGLAGIDPEGDETPAPWHSSEGRDNGQFDRARVAENLIASPDVLEGIGIEPNDYNALINVVEEMRRMYVGDGSMGAESTTVSNDSARNWQERMAGLNRSFGS